MRFSLSIIGIVPNKNFSMRKKISIFFYIAAQSVASAQICNLTDATACLCKDTSQVNCDLLPDVTVSSQTLTEPGGYLEYPQQGIPGQGAVDGRLTLSVAIPNIGVGPLEVRATSLLLCGNDTVLDNPLTCPDGSLPQLLIQQRIYHKSNDTMSYYLRMAGTVSYHSLHSHFHVDDWSFYSLRIKKPGEPNPLLWPIVGKTTKNGFCLENSGPCSMRPGYCRDKNNDTLLDNNFPNNTMSAAGYFSCSSLLQGISPGYFDEYPKEFFGMWIDVPTGTCNGNYYLVIVVDPLNRIKESDETNNCIVVPITLTKQDAPGNPKAFIYPEGLTTICQGDSLRLRATAGISYLWSTGDTVQTITVKTAGTYSVTVNSPCGVATSTPVNIAVVNLPTLPIITGDTICVGDSATLKASGSDSLYWYVTPVGGKVFHSGSSFVTPPLSSSKTYYVENAKTIPGFNYNGGLPDSTAQGKYYPANGYASHLLFDCVSAFTLKGVTLYAKDTGTAFITLHDGQGYVLKKDTVKIVKGKNHVVLNFQIPPGDNYALGLKGDSIFYGENGNVKYPYDIPGVLSIRKSSIGKSSYLFFYNWEITTADLICRSARIAVKAEVSTACTVGLTSLDMRLHVKVHPNPLNTYSIFSVDKNYVESPYSFVLYDILGRPVFKEENINSDSFQIDRNNLQGGAYLYKLYFKNNLTVSGKLLIQ
jgi:hypothetical protein